MIGRMISSTDAKENTTTYEYNALGQVTEKKIPFAVDNNKNMVYTYNTYKYDLVGNLLQESVTDGVTNNYTYDYRNRLTKAVSGSQTVDYVYDDAGNITQYKTGGGTQIHEYTYDSLNRVTQYTNPMGNIETYKYDSNQDMTSKVDRNGNTIEYTYDGLHRMLTEKADGVNNTWEYALTGGITSEKNDNASKTYTYNDKGLVLTENTTIGSDKFSINRYYDLIGNNLYEFYYKNNQNYRIMRYWHDNRNRMKTVDESTDGGTNYKRYVEYYYDKNSNLASTHYGNNTYDVYYYNAANLVTCMDMVDKNTGNKYQHFTYTYRLDGNIIGKDENVGSHIKTVKYNYNNEGQLSNEEYTGYNHFNIAYTYDKSGNRETAVYSGDEVRERTERYTYDANNRLTKIVKEIYGANYDSIIDYAYDNNGNLLRVDKYTKNKTGAFKIAVTDAYSRYSNTGSEEFTYNGLNQLIGYTNTNNSYNGKAGINAEYKYMANGLRLAKYVNAEKTNYLWNGDQMFMEVHPNDIRSYTKLPGYMRTGTNKVMQARTDNYYIFNGHGDVVGLTDMDGNKTKDYEYDAFGNESGASSSDTNPFRYCGEFYDKETGLIYLRNRYYDPSIGRFINEDPIRDGFNWYSYCGGNPVRFIDPSGKIYEYEQKMYDNGEMAPMAYTYLMKQTYDYLLADSQKEKDKIKADTDRFRETGYKETGIKMYDDGIKKMPEKPSLSISEDEHFFRNELNLTYSYDELQKINKVAPENVKWVLYSPEKSALHQNTSPDKSNKKYVTADGHFEAVYNKNGELLSENCPVDMGTYNYGVSIPDHFILDILPYYTYGGNVKNSGEDPIKSTIVYYGDKIIKWCPSWEEL